jgi:hypothetical protein
VGIGTSTTTYDLHVEGNTYSTDIYTSALHQTSDERLKTDVTPIVDALDKVQRLQGVYYKWKSTLQPSVGLIAQNVEDVIPEVVATVADGTKTIAYGQLVGVLVEAIKDLESRLQYVQQFANVNWI